MSCGDDDWCGSCPDESCDSTTLDIVYPTTSGCGGIREEVYLCLECYAMWEHEEPEKYDRIVIT